MKRLVVLLVVTGLLGAACAQAPPPPAPTPAPPPPTSTPPPMAGKLILYGDLALFAGRDNPDNCILKNRYKRGEPVGFRMTAIDPMTGKYVETADLVVNVTYGGKSEQVPMRYRGTGENPRPGFWTAKWVVPDNAPTGVVKYSITAKDKEGRAGEFKPFDIELSQLTVVN